MRACPELPGPSPGNALSRRRHSAMTNIENALREALREAVRGQVGASVMDVQRVLWDELHRLCDEGKVAPGEDPSLSGRPLEWRVQGILQTMRFCVRKGRECLEDLVVDPPPECAGSDPLVLEVKSSRKPCLARDDLRQLDDWVFDLSG